MNELEIMEYIKKYYHTSDIQKRGNEHYLVLYHGTSSLNIDSILKEGLKGGDNTHGGTHGTFDDPTLFLALEEDLAKKYGEVIEIWVPFSEFKEFDKKALIKTDGLWDYVVIVKAKNWDDVIIPVTWLDYYEDDDV